MDCEASPINGQSLTVKEFCAKHRIAPCTFYKLKSQGRAPKLMFLGRAIRITPEAEMAWRAAREQPDDTEARLLKREADARKRSSRKAAKISVASPNHVSRRSKKA